MAKNISSSEVRALQTATPQELQQAESLILRGKAGAVRGDPRMQRIVNALSAVGVQSVESQRYKQEALERQQQQKFQGPVRPTTDEEYFRRTGKVKPKVAFQGPVPKGTTTQQEQSFRQTGTTEEVEPFIEERPTGETYKGTPTTQLIYVNPETNEERLATQEETDYFRSKTRKLQASKEGRTTTQRLKATPTGQKIQKFREDYGESGFAEIGRITNVQKQYPEKKLATGTVPLIPAFSLGILGASKVKALGVSQQVSGTTQGTVKTDVLFEISKKGLIFDTKSVGAVKSLFVFKKISDSTSVVKTTSVGNIAKSTRTNLFKDITTNPNTKFASIQEAVVKQTGNKIESIGRGIIAQNIKRGVQFPTGKEVIKTEKVASIFGGVGATKGDLTIGFTKSFARTGNLYGFSTIKQTTPKDNFIIGISKTSKLDLIKSQALQSTLAQIPTQSSKTAFISTTPAGISTITKTQLPKTQTQIVKTQTLEKIQQSQLQIPTSKVKQILLPKQRTQQVQQTKQLLISKEKQKISTTQIAKQQQILQQRQKSIAGLKFLQIPTQTNQQRLGATSLLKGTQRGTSLNIPLPITKPIPFFLPRIKRKLRTSRRREKYGVQVRRRGQFISVGSGLSLQKAMSLGSGITGRTTIASFKLIPQQKGKSKTGIRTPFGFKQKEGLIFIEQPKYRISTVGEIMGLRKAKRRKRK